MLNTKEDMTRGIVCAGINIKYQIGNKWDCEEQLYIRKDNQTKL